MRLELIGVGTEGYPHSQFIEKCRTHIFKGADIIAILDEWHTRDLVQKFEVKLPTSKRPIVYWRATSLIVDGRL